MDRNQWKLYVYHLSWQCPACQSGRYRLVPDTMLKIMSRAERNDRADPDGNHDELLERFTAHLQCDSTFCAETATIAGDYYVGWFNDGTDEGHTDTSYRPFHIHPAPLPFKIHHRVPRPIQDLVQSAASLLWSDPKASAGRIREVIDAMLSDLEIDTVSAKGGRLILHQRIDRLRLIEDGKWDEQADIIEAAKWIGNEGAHESVKRNDVLDAFEMLEVVLEDIYNRTRSELLEKVRKTNEKHRKSKPKFEPNSKAEPKTD